VPSQREKKKKEQDFLDRLPPYQDLDAAMATPPPHRRARALLPASLPRATKTSTPDMTVPLDRRAGARARALLPAALVLLALSAAAALVAPAAAAADAALVQAQATWYTGIYQGFCQSFGNLPPDRFIAAMPTGDTASPPLGAACGECLAVWCRPGRVADASGAVDLDRSDACASATEGVVVQVTDTCSCQYNAQWCCGREPGTGRPTHVDLSQEAFRALAKNGDAGLGLLAIEWAPVSCGLLGQRVTREGLAVAAPVPPPLPTPPLPTPTTPEPTTPPKPIAIAPAPTGPGTPPKRPPVNKPQTPSAAAFAAAAQKLCPTPGLWSQAGEGTQLARSRKRLGRLEQCGGAGASCCAYARPVAAGKRVQGSCYDRPFAGRTCDQGTTCQRKNAWYWQCL
jgi:hypothetical protein